MRKLLSAAWSLAFAGLVVFVMVIVWRETFGHVIGAFGSRSEARRAADEIRDGIASQTPGGEAARPGTTPQDAAAPGEEALAGRFHRVEVDVPSDVRSACVLCHGELPHREVPELRAFWNMHGFVLACETCHVRLEGAAATSEYAWYDRTTGALVSGYGTSAGPAPYTARLIPLERVDGKLRRVDSQARLDAAAAFRSREEDLSPRQRETGLLALHSHLSLRPYVCDDCHGEAPLLPLAALGYDQRRIDSILGTEVVGMLQDYRVFYIPELQGETPGAGHGEVGP